MNLMVRVILLVVVLNAFGDCLSKKPDRKKVKNSRRFRSSSDAVQAPPTGQLVRLLHSDGSSLRDGQVEIYTRQGYGIVCSNKWDKQDADVACRQMGFLRGAEKISAGKFSGSPGSRLFLNNVNCRDQAQTLQDCNWETVTACPAGNTARVVCLQNEGCPDEWVAGPTSCYQLLPNTITKREFAMNKCAEHGGHLVAIETEAENHFISNAFWDYSKGPVLTGGLKIDGTWMWESMTRKVNGREVETNTRTSIKYFRWFPGWQPGNALSEPTGGKMERCLFLANMFEHPNGSEVAVDYFFWLDERCSSSRKRFQSGFQYICEKPLGRTDAVGCYDDIGTEYRGQASRTKTGSLCMNWSLAPDINPKTYPETGLGNHSFCRNPDRDESPWCWISPENFEFCDIPRCNTTDVSHTDESAIHQSPESNCSSEEFMCSSRVCIPAFWKCDMEPDCEQGDDENQSCEYKLEEFKVTRGMTLRGYEEEIYTGATNETCARYCVNSKRFVCVAFSFSPRTRECLISLHNSETGQFKFSRREDLYELISQLNDCEGMHRCDNDRCVEMSEVCDGKDQCGDFSDEKSCVTGSRDDVSVRLMDGTRLSGRVEVKYKGEWGIICDDNWDDNDANVVCRMLGFHGESTALQRSFYGRGDGDFLLDEVECDGSEKSIDQCEHSGWKNHDCFIWEVAAVRCTEEVDECNAAKEFTCTEDKSCVSLHAVCDGTCQCSGCSDEKTCVSVVELVGGSLPSEGRVEIVLNGIRGTICDDEFDDVDATVVCKSLGYGYGSVVKERELFGQGQGLIWMDDVSCVGNESDIVRCPHFGPLDQNCGHDEDVAVVCQAADAGIQVVLEGGTEKRGRVVLISEGVKGTICDDDWTDSNARVICRMLGYSGGQALTGSYYGPADDTLQIFLDDVQCTGSEESIDLCKHSDWLVHNCDHTEDAGVTCDNVERITTKVTLAPKTSPVPSTKAPVDTVEDCLQSGVPYKGKIAETENGFECQQWKLNTPHLHKHHNDSAFPDGSVAGAENYCRTPDNDAQPWCYTTDPDERWGYCNIPICKENCFSNASEYTGPTRHTTSGHTCQSWASNSPHSHKYHTDSNFPDKTVQAAGNKCRSPDNDVTPWCYTTNADVRWEYCNVTKCAAGGFNFSSSCGLRPLENSRARRDVGEEDIPYNYRKMGRIYGGIQATYGMYPWQAAIRRRLGFLSMHLHHCGGTIIGEYWIVSAAHCFRDASKGQIIVRTGDLNSGFRDKYEQEFDVDNIIIHEQYSSYGYDYDIALLKLRPIYGRGIVFNDYVQPACLPNDTTPYQPGQQCLISGWGEYEDDSQSIHLKAARVPIVDHRTCNRLYKQTITSNMVCAGYLAGGTDTCAGDSGGPLVCKIQDKYTLMGVVSFGEECALANAPGVYAKVAAFVPWIRRTLARYG